MNSSTCRITAVFLAFIMCFATLSCLAVTDADAAGVNFFIDVGHGGMDPGAVLKVNGVTVRQEADDVLNLSLRVAELIAPYATYKLSRTTALSSSTDFTLKQRSTMANNAGADFCISIHRNSFENPAAKGLEVWWSEWTQSYNTTACINFAQSVYDNVMEQVPVWTERGLKSGYKLHMTTYPTMPSCLIETGFISNTTDNEIFDQYFEEIAYGIANGMLAMIGKKLEGDTTDHKLDGQDPVDMGKDFYARIANESIGKYFTDKNGEVWAEGLSGEANQVWHFMRQANGAYLIGNSATAKFLQVKDAVYQNGSRLVTGDVTFDAHQKFYIYYMYGNFYMMPEGRDMTVDIDCTLFHTQICGTSTEKDKSEASFKARSLNLEITSVYDGTRAVSDLGESFTAQIKNVASGKFVTANGANLVGADKNGLDTQKWTFNRLPSGCYTISSVSEKLAIDVANTLLAEGTPVDMYDLTNLNAQRFFLIEKDGSYYIKSTYTMNTLHYNSADGQFYANTTGDAADKLAAQKFELIIDGAADEENKLVLKDDSSYVKDETSLNKVSAGKTAADVLANFKNENAVVKKADGTAVASTAKVGTGYTVDLVVNGAKVDSVVIIILGEVTGEGSLDTTDYLKIKTSLQGGVALDGVFYEAADVDGNDKVDTVDYMRVKSYLMGEFDLYA